MSNIENLNEELWRRHEELNKAVDDKRKTRIDIVSLTDEDILDISLYSSYLSLISPNSTTINLPDNNTTWNYSTGYVLKRGNAAWITLYGHYTSGSPEIARNYYTGSKWVGWDIS